MTTTIVFLLISVVIIVTTQVELVTNEPGIEKPSQAVTLREYHRSENEDKDNHPETAIKRSAKNSRAKKRRKSRRGHNDHRGSRRHINGRSATHHSANKDDGHRSQRRDSKPRETELRKGYLKSEVKSSTILPSAEPIAFAVTADVFVGGLYSYCPENQTMGCPGCDWTCNNKVECNNLNSCNESEQACDCDYGKLFVREQYTMRHSACIRIKDCLKCPENQVPMCESKGCPHVTCDNFMIAKSPATCADRNKECTKRFCACDYNKGYVKKDYSENSECVQMGTCPFTCPENEQPVCPVKGCKELKFSNKDSSHLVHCPPHTPDCQAPPECHCVFPYLRNDQSQPKIFGNEHKCVPYSHFCKVSYSNTWPTAYCNKPKDCILACKKDKNMTFPLCPNQDEEKYRDCWDGKAGRHFECGCADGKLRHIDKHKHNCLTIQECQARLLSRKRKRKRPKPVVSGVHHSLAPVDN